MVRAARGAPATSEIGPTAPSIVRLRVRLRRTLIGHLINAITVPFAPLIMVLPSVRGVHSPRSGRAADARRRVPCPWEEPRRQNGQACAFADSAVKSVRHGDQL